jgi:Ca2+-dependent lipid-binding protein
VNECNPAWNETLQIPIHYPAYVDNVIIRLIDANVFKSKEVIGSCYISLL